MKTKPRLIHRISLLCLALLVVLGTVATSRADQFNAAYLEGADGVWERDGFWSTSAYPNNGHVIINSSGNPVPGPNPTYDVLISVPTPCTLGIGVTIQTLNVLNGSTLNLAPNARITANTGMGVGGLVTLNATASGNSGLRIGQALSGGSGIVSPGVISMSDNGGNYVSGAAYGVTFTIQSGAILRGAGQLNLGYFGGNEFLMNFVNHGLIDAFHTNNALQIGVGEQTGPPFVDAKLTNDGVVRASGNGTLRFRAFNNIGNVLNAGGTIAAIDNGTVRVAAPVVVTGGTLATAGNGTIRGDYPGNGGGTFKDLVNVGVLAQAQAETFGFAGTITNNGLVRLDGNADSNTGLLIRDANVTLAGTGVIAMNGAAGIAGADVVGRTLTIAPGATIRGRGQFGTNNSSFLYKALNVTNQGLIDATGPLTMFLDNPNSSNVTNTNGGILRASAGGTLHFTGPGSVFNSGGTIEAQTGSAVRVNHLVTIEGGVVTSSGTGVIAGGTAGAGGGTLKNVTNNGTIALDSSERLGAIGTLTNNGLIGLNNSGLALRGGDVTLAGTGLVTIANGATIAGDLNVGQTLTINPGQTIRGSGQLGVGNSNFELKSINVVNRGLVEATGVITNWVINNQNSNFTNSGGTFRANGAGSVLQFREAGTVNNTGGLLEALEGGSLQFDNGTALTNLSAGVLTGGIYRVSTTDAATQIRLNAGAISRNAATVVLSGANAQFPGLSSLTQNDGTLVLNNGATLSVGGIPSAAAKGSSDAPSAIFPNAGKIVLGQGSSLTVNADFAQGQNGAMEVVIGGPTSSFHALNVTGTANLAGALTVKLANGYVPAPNETYPILQAAAVNGGFTSVTGATIAYGPNGVTVHPTGNTNALQLVSAVSRKVHGTAGALDIPLPLTGEPGVECRSSGGNHTLVFTFSNDVVAGNVSVTGGTASIVGNRTIAGKTLSVDLTGVADAQQITVSLSDVTDAFSQVLPSATVAMKTLLGDTNGNRQVNATDIAQTKAQSGTFVTQANCRQDVNVNGAINASDIGLVKSRSGASVP